MGNRFSPLFILMAAMLWGTTGTAQAFAPDSAHPIAIGAIRLAVGGLSLLLITLLLGQLNVKNWPIKTTILAACCMAMYQPLFFTAVSMTGVAIGTVIAIGSAPIISGGLERLVLKTRPSRVWWYATLLSIIGCFLLFFNKEAVQVEPFGILLALGAGFAFASYTFVSKNLVEEKAPLPVLAIVFTMSALMLAPFLFVYNSSWLMETRGIAVGLHLGLVATGAAYFLFSKGLVHTPSSTAVTLSLAEPLTATVLGVFVVGEYLNVTSWMGILLLLMGIGLLVFASSKANKEKGTINIQS